MKKRGISIEGVASQIGVLSGPELSVDRDRLIVSLINRFQASEEDAKLAIHEAGIVGAVTEHGRMVSIKR